MKKRVKNALKICVGLIYMLFSLTPLTSYAWVDENDDQTELTEEEIQQALESGQIDLSQDMYEQEVMLANDTDYAMKTIAGNTRYETSVLEAMSAFQSADVVIIASGESYVDSIAGASLAGVLDAPILLTNPTVLSQVTKDAIATLSPSKIVILGGDKAVSSEVEAELKIMTNEVIRLGGEDRFDTQLHIYSYGSENGYWTADATVICTGLDFADALSISPVVFQQKLPVFFVGQNKNLTLNEKQILKETGVSQYIILGGEQVVSDEVDTYLSAFGSVIRLSGKTRYETSLKINRYAIQNCGFNWNSIAIASGKSPWDALGGGVMQGKFNRLITLMDVNQQKKEPEVYIDQKPDEVVFLGGKDVYPNYFKAEVAYKMGYGIQEIEGFKIYIDAGHGWNDLNNGLYATGAGGCGRREVDLNQELADKVSDILKYQYGMNVFVNKKGWYKLRQAQAKELDCGLFLSIHFNAAGGSGTETYTHSYNAQWGSEHLQDCVTGRLVAATGLENRGEKKEEFAVCGGSVPAVLCEICFIDNWNDMYTYDRAKDSIASALAEGIMAW